MQPFDPRFLLLENLLMSLLGFQLGEEFFLFFFHPHVPSQVHTFIFEKVNVLDEPFIVRKNITKVLLVPRADLSFESLHLLLKIVHSSTSCDIQLLPPLVNYSFKFLLLQPKLLKAKKLGHEGIHRILVEANWPVILAGSWENICPDLS